MVQEFTSEDLLNLLRDRPCLELMIVLSNFSALLLLQDKLLESVGKLRIPVKKSKYDCTHLSQRPTMEGSDKVPGRDR